MNTIQQAVVQWNIALYRQLIQLAQANKLPSAILLKGAQGIGKKAFAQQIVNAMCCQKLVELEPCGNCKNCKLMAANNYFDKLQIEVEQGQNIAVDQIRDMITKLGYHALQHSWMGKIKIVVLNQPEKMTETAANALLKILEEPPTNVYFILVSDFPDLLLATIRSRVQQFQLKAPSEEQTNHLLSNVFDTATLTQIKPLVTVLSQQPMYIEQLKDNQLIELVEEIRRTCLNLTAKPNTDFFALVDAIHTHKEHHQLLFNIYYLLILQICQHYNIFNNDLYSQLYQALREMRHSGIDKKNLWLTQFVHWKNFCQRHFNL